MNSIFPRVTQEAGQSPNPALLSGLSLPRSALPTLRTIFSPPKAPGRLLYVVLSGLVMSFSSWQTSCSFSKLSVSITPFPFSKLKKTRIPPDAPGGPRASQQTSIPAPLISLKFRALFTAPQPHSLWVSLHHLEGPSQKRGEQAPRVAWGGLW